MCFKIRGFVVVVVVVFCRNIRGGGAVRNSHGALCGRLAFEPQYVSSEICVQILFFRATLT